MRVLRIEINRFRNYHNESILFEDGINIFLGNNGEGKTNILEAIYMLSLGRSFRTNKDRDMILLGSDTAYVRAIVESQGREYKIEYRIDAKTKKAIKINGVPISKISELLGIVNVVIFSPEDLGLVKDGPRERRSFIDRELSQLRPRYYNLLNNYYKSLSQRNNLLKEKIVDGVLLEVYDEQLAVNGTEIIKYRQDFVNQVAEIAMENHKKISGGKEDLTVRYEKSIRADSIEDYKKFLAENREKDILRRTSTVGIHRDDLNIQIDGIDLRSYGSQGQKRSAAISLKLSEIQLVKEIKGEYPVVLLDDIFSELDKGRQCMLLESIRHTQTFITTAEDLEVELDTTKYRIKAGKINE